MSRACCWVQCQGSCISMLMSARLSLQGNHFITTRFHLVSTRLQSEPLARSAAFTASPGRSIHLESARPNPVATTTIFLLTKMV